jgi:hypothetical protein
MQQFNILAFCGDILPQPKLSHTTKAKHTLRVSKLKNGYHMDSFQKTVEGNPQGIKVA